MAHSLQDKLATINPDRRARIDAEADHLHEEYLKMQKSLNPQDDEHSDTHPERR